MVIFNCGFSIKRNLLKNCDIFKARKKRKTSRLLIPLPTLLVQFTISRASFHQQSGLPSYLAYVVLPYHPGLPSINRVIPLPTLLMQFTISRTSFNQQSGPLPTLLMQFTISRASFNQQSGPPSYLASVVLPYPGLPSIRTFILLLPLSFLVNKYVHFFTALCCFLQGCVF